MIFNNVLQSLALAILVVSQSFFLAAAKSLSTGEDVANFVDTMIQQNQVSTTLARSKRSVLLRYFSVYLLILCPSIAAVYPTIWGWDTLKLMVDETLPLYLVGRCIRQELLSVLPTNEGFVF
jgi:hypothetical protein